MTDITHLARSACAHRFHNPTNRYSTLLRVFAEPTKEAGRGGGNAPRATRSGSRPRALKGLLSLVRSCCEEAVVGPLLKIFDFSNSEIELDAVKQLLDRDFAMGLHKSRKFHTLLTGAARPKSSLVNETLLRRGLPKGSDVNVPRQP